MSFRSMNCREDKKHSVVQVRLRVFTQSQWDCGTEKELSETRLSLLG